MDRLAAMRAQQQGGHNPYARQDDHAYEMADVKDSSTNLTSAADSMSAFYSEISSIQDSIKSFNANVSRIGELHSRSLNSTDDAAGQRDASQLQDLVEDTSTLSTTLKRRIKALESQGASARDAQIRKQQTALVKAKFVDAIQTYQTVEQQYRQKYKQRIERQLKIVKPDATPDEVRAVVNDENGGQIFTQALMNSNRYGESKSAYREVQQRHQGIKRIEQTITELAQLFNDMSMMVEQQDEAINTIQATAAMVEKDTEVGLQHTGKAVKSARSARKKRWICFFLLIVIGAIIAIVIVVVVKNNNK